MNAADKLSVCGMRGNPRSSLIWQTSGAEDLRSLLSHNEEARLDAWLSSQSDVARHSAASDVIEDEPALDSAIVLSDWNPNERKAALNPYLNDRSSVLPPMVACVFTIVQLLNIWRQNVFGHSALGACRFGLSSG